MCIQRSIIHPEKGRKFSYLLLLPYALISLNFNRSYFILSLPNDLQFPNAACIPIFFLYSEHSHPHLFPPFLFLRNSYLYPKTLHECLHFSGIFSDQISQSELTFSFYISIVTTTVFMYITLYNNNLYFCLPLKYPPKISVSSGQKLLVIHLYISST